ncbi:cadmium resistance transporter [Limosilactobacillus reuteri]|uniref:cadmium resistance transporter n=1 Tax=Limosilactobacillus reuteri TaxID=1598 RepID=UPI000A1F72CA|nr:cadmium resistance transporter [Limosilactobacillus reuteri]MCC4440790.1 CadD family cadmium resistance transporter [Limosilactobacillus reuteri]
MNVLAIIMIYIGINIDTFIALMFVIHRYNLYSILTGFVSAELFLWLIGILLGKTITTIFPDWITGFMGFLLLYLGVHSKNQEEMKEKNTEITEVFLLCLSLGGDNLAVLIPLAGTMNFLIIILVTIVFTLCSVLTIIVARWVAKIKPLTFFLEKYGGYCTKLVYIFAGIYIILNSQVIQHILILF